MDKNEIQKELKELETKMEALRKKLDEPERELYRGWIPKVGDEYYYSDNTGYVGEAYANDPIETEWDKDRSILGVFPTEAEAKTTYERHMAGEECKKIISKWINELAPGWKLDWRCVSHKHYLALCCNESIDTSFSIEKNGFQNEWYFPFEVANNKGFLAEVEPHFRKWLGVE